MRILVTGDCGFIGTALKDELMGHGHQVLGFDLERDISQDVIFGFTGAIGRADPKLDLVVHLAAEVGKANCEANSERAVVVNVYGTMNVARVCALYEVPLVFCSTSEVYGDWGQSVVAEDAWLVSGNEKLSGVYALTKRWGEEVCQTYAPEELKIIRPTMPYGPGVPPGPGRRALDNLVWQGLRKQPMVVHRGAARSWCWVDDVASGIRTVIEHGSPGVYNVGRDDDEVSMFALAHDICELTGARPHDVVEVDGPERQTLVKRISCAKLRALGWEPTVERAEGLPRMVDWVEEWMSR